MSMMKKWEIEWGSLKIPVTAERVVHAMDMAVSTVQKELAHNNVIRSDPRLKTDWEQGLLILELVRNQFSALWDIENSKVAPKIPKMKSN